jgi:hypothetical protein
MSDTHNEIFDAVGEKYLLLHRENYIEEDDVQRLLAPLARRASKKEINRLLNAPDWRMKLVGVYLVVSQGDSTFARALAEMLSTPGGRQVRRPICIALAVLRDSSAVAGLAAFLYGAY